MKKFFSKKISLFFHFLIIAISIYVICDSENMQKRFCPSKYWKRQISTIEDEIQKNEEKKALLQKKMESNDSVSELSKNESDLGSNTSVLEKKEDEVAGAKVGSKVDTAKEIESLTSLQKAKIAKLQEANIEYLKTINDR